MTSRWSGLNSVAKGLRPSCAYAIGVALDPLKQEDELPISPIWHQVTITPR
jgi:hypothetical protein